MEPILIARELVSYFKFWQDGQIHDGMRWKHELFTHFQTFDKLQRQKVYDCAWTLADRQIQVIITASNSDYQVWTNLRTRGVLFDQSIDEQVKNMAIGCSIDKAWETEQDETETPIRTEASLLLKVIAFTAYAGEINQQPALVAGFQYHLSKLISLEALDAVIHLTASAD